MLNLHCQTFLLFAFTVFSPQHIRMCLSFLGTFAYFCNFFNHSSSLISHPDFVFLFVFLMGETISLRHKLVCLFQWGCPLGYLVIIYLSFRFPPCFFQSSFQRYGNVVFFSAIIFFLNSAFILSSCIKIYFWGVGEYGFSVWSFYIIVLCFVCFFSLILIGRFSLK